MKSKVAGIIFIFSSIYYMGVEFISASFTNISLFNTYCFHTISELGIPNHFSSFYYLMNSGFIVVGLGLLFGVFLKFKDLIVKNKLIFYVLSFVTSIGVIIVAMIHGGNPLTLSYHMLGAIMAIVGGNLLLIVVSRSMSEFGFYQKMSLILGIIGEFSFLLLLVFNSRDFFPVFERLSVYTLIFWSFFTGIYLLRNNLYTCMSK